MRRFAFLPIAGVLFAALGCEHTPDPPPNPNEGAYQLVAPATEVSVGQDSTISLRDFGLVVVRDGVDTIQGPNQTTQPIPRLSYFIDDRSIAFTDQFGIVRGLKGGTTRFVAIGYGAEVSFNVTVRERPATLVRLSVLSGPGGGYIPNRLDTGTFYALPAERLAAKLEGLVLVGTDTVFCNWCTVKPTATARIMRLVNFRSLNPALAGVSNASNPYAQRTSSSGSQTGNQVNVDTTGYVTAFDTTSTPVGIVMEVPGDGLADTVYLKFALRPLDTLRIRPDSGDFPPSDFDDIGTERRVFPNADTVQANVVQSTVSNFTAGVDYLFKSIRMPTAPSTSNPNPVWLTTRQTGNVYIARTNLPSISWESANTVYMQVNGAGQITVPCASIGGSCTSSGSKVLTCNSVGSEMPQDFGGQGNYAIPSCGTSIPMPGAFCTTTSTTELSSTCTIWLRASFKDQATGKLIRDLYRVNVRR
jgi:hypothetical protein